MSGRWDDRTWGNGDHGRAEFYIDGDLFHLLMFKSYARTDSWPSAPYKPKLTSEPGEYFHGNVADLISYLHHP